MARKSNKNEAEVRPIIVKKIIADDHAGHHGGAWKVAYADFVTAMMAFFLLLWLLGATNDKERKGIADYFKPTILSEPTDNSNGGVGFLKGDTLAVDQDLPTHAKLSPDGPKLIAKNPDTLAQAKEIIKQHDQQRFDQLRKMLEEHMQKDPALAKLKQSVRLVETREGLRIDLVDQSDFAMFTLGTETMVPPARKLIAEVARVIKDVPNMIIVRGHTDALPYASGRNVNNWTLSADRADATRQALIAGGVNVDRFDRIEGLADREPYVPDNRMDPRNRRMSIILSWLNNDSGRDQPITSNEGRSDPTPHETKAAATLNTQSQNKATK
ncbi:MAG: flagellar motor protein MotB [Zymomonas mobilis subsp. pomaceae]|uniref:OmpA/MotB domain protein n=1 Tax=Zymomonas mobilis subsp. pomaceae (strain ATCC 29192 / DSM 22645 / JCM 10191 / CCUG 17912 / NBRC 13757 / NCIMB 11200 / NRRL B-4491 / Barker I) TaxID=579138 RepID=F8ERR3_ZYMMT|nr:flagellar motor protein MotB [Zymomonas mobilis]AEI37521.1 OmpA/MotB domain protein [Zymomonas mobilis subsp. pomaceae ATCC 29192]MDX5948889.1 flagellar motor protein MotB [Zymomonas mobilis subsp. pomaceae]GEB88696.1 flagellar motor protein MotB [Zymomonas mobilis subsp. pomaceae]